jgi:hypothetical protein
MSIGEPTCSEVYNQCLASLRASGAEELVKEIERAMARGVVLTEQETEIYEKSTVYRPMEDKEALAVALESLVTALEVPLMLGGARHILGDKPIEWRLERPGTEREEITASAANQVDQQRLHAYLLKIIEIARELGINVPEMA